MKSPCCENCMYWDTSTWIKIDENDTNACRRYPPSRVNSTESEFPETYAADWCGEHSRDTSNRPRKKKVR